MELSYLLLLVTCILYGASGMIAEWRDFPSKLANALVIIVLIVLLLVTLSPGHAGFFRKSDDFWWIDFLMPIPVGNNDMRIQYLPFNQRKYTDHVHSMVHTSISFIFICKQITEFLGWYSGPFGVCVQCRVPVSPLIIFILADFPFFQFLRLLLP